MANQENEKAKQLRSHGTPIPGLLSALRSISQVASATVILVGCLVLVGWMLDIETLKRILPGLIGMNATAAIAFILAGVSLRLLRAERVDQRRLRIAQGCAFAVALVGLLKLIEVLFGWDLGIDQLFFREKLDVGYQLPNRMAPNTALNFLLVGSALLLLDRQTRRGRWPAQYLTLAAAFASSLPLVGYAYGIESFYYGTASYIPMPLPTALTFVVLVVGLLCVRPDRGLMAVFTSDSAGGVMARRLLPAAILIPAVLGWLRLEGEWAELYDTELGVALMVLASMAIFAALIGWNARLLYRIDIERQRTEEALRKSEARNRAVVDTASDGVITMTIDGFIRSFNPAAEHIFGYTAEEAIRQPLKMLMPERFQASYKAGLHRYLETSEAHIIGKGPVELVGLRKNGEEFPLELSVGEMREEDDILFTGIVRDVTERKRAEEALRKSEERFRLVVEGVKDYAIFMLDRGGRVASWNEGAHRIKGYLQEEILGRHFSVFYPQEDVKRGKPERVLRKVEAEGAYEEEGWRVRKDGTRFWASVLITALRDEEGNLRGFSKVTRDITERKRAEDEIRRLNETLEERVAERTAQLIERERQLKDLLGKLVAAQEEERRRVAYEVHDGLTQVAVAAHQHLQAFADDHPPGSKVGPEELDRALELAQRTVKEARRVIEGLRPTTLDDFGLATALRQQVEELRAEGWKIDYEQALGDERLPAEVETALYRVAQEALTNVQKHAQATEARITLARLSGKVRLEVRDEGRGFDPAAVSGDGGPGERVGLSGMRERVALLGGKLKITSKPGAGTSLAAEIPLPVSEEMETGHER